MSESDLKTIAAANLGRARGVQSSPGRHDNAIVSIAASLCRIADGIEERNEQMVRHIDLIEKETAKRAALVDGHLDSVSDSLAALEGVVVAATNVIEAYENMPEISDGPGGSFERKIYGLERKIEEAIEVMDR